MGANSGHFAALCANRTGRDGRVHSIEANPYLATRLKEAFRTTTEVCVHHAAAGAQAGRAVFSVATFSGWSSLIPNETYDVKEKVEVDQITLDGLIQSQGIERVRLLKLDIEGGELAALRGAAELRWVRGSSTTF